MIDLPANPKENAVCFCRACCVQQNYDAVLENQMICPSCGAYMRMHARERLRITVDSGSFQETDQILSGESPAAFPSEPAMLTQSRKVGILREAVICGTAAIAENPCAIFVMDSFFITEHAGKIVVEKITRLFERASAEKLPVIGIITSGDIGMKKSIFSPMQMAKISGAVRQHSDKGGLYISVLTDPTTGGIMAGFAMQGDVIIAEPNALIGFAGKHTLEQTTGEKLPEGFQRAEFLLEHGFLDIVEPRENIRYTLGKLLNLHSSRKRSVS